MQESLFPECLPKKTSMNPLEEAAGGAPIYPFQKTPNLKARAALILAEKGEQESIQAIQQAKDSAENYLDRETFEKALKLLRATTPKT